MARSKRENQQRYARKKSQAALQEQQARAKHRKEQAEKRRRAKPIIEAHQEKLGHISVGPLFTVDEDERFSDEFDQHLLRTNLSKKESQRAMDPNELTVALSSWSIDELQTLWSKRDKKISSQYDAARLLARIRLSLGIDSAARDPASLMGIEVIRAMAETHESGLETAHHPEPQPTGADFRRVARVRQTVREDQAGFRARLIEHYGLRCMVTGVTTAAVIEAAHIAPYGGRATNTVENGLLLRTDIHRLFDAGLMSIDPQTLRLEFAESVTDAAYADLAGRGLLLQAPSRISIAALRTRWQAFHGEHAA
ncbi:hypothetical protein T35B1_11742 [Salinisphaera shabanensis T35B1]|uniref:HNH endonuclease n=1 Tax=Salinisphaera TaxID=180541 RepID=UPI00334088D2